MSTFSFAGALSFYSYIAFRERDTEAGENDRSEIMATPDNYCGLVVFALTFFRLEPRYSDTTTASSTV